MPEFSQRGFYERLLNIMPRPALHRNVRTVYAKDVEGIRLAPLARRQCSRLHDQRAVALYLVAFRGAPDVADVEVPGEKKIGPDRGERSHRHVRASNQVFGGVVVGQIERMMRHDDLDHVRRHTAETIGRVPDLSSVRPTAAKGKRASAVQPER